MAYFVPLRSYSLTHSLGLKSVDVWSGLKSVDVWSGLKSVPAVARKKGDVFQRHSVASLKNELKQQLTVFN